MERYNSAKLTLQNMLLKRSCPSEDSMFFDDDASSIFSLENENRFQSRATLYGRSNVTRGYSTVASNEDPSAQFSKTMRQSLYKRKKEPSAASEQKQRPAPSWLQRMRPSLYRRRCEQIPSGDDMAGLMAISQSPPTGEDRLLGDNSATGHDDSAAGHEDSAAGHENSAAGHEDSAAGHEDFAAGPEDLEEKREDLEEKREDFEEEHKDFEVEHEDPEKSILTQHQINAMYWSAKIKDEFTTQLLTKTNLRPNYYKDKFTTRLSTKTNLRPNY